MQRILIQALPREGLTGRPRCKRVWPSDKPVAVEVVSDSKTPVKINGGGEDYWGPTIAVVQRNPHTNLEETVLRPDPQRITHKELEAIKADPVLRILSDGETVSELSQAAMDAARKQAADLASELTGVKAQLAETKEKLAASQARVTDLEAQLAAQKASTDMGKPSEEPEHHEKSKGGGKAK